MEVDMNLQRVFGVALATALLSLPLVGARPASAYTVKSAQIIGSYTPEDAGHGANRGRDLPAVIVGNPFPVPPEATAQAVSLGMRNGRPGPSLHGPQAAVAPQRVIWQLDGGTRTGSQICDRRNPLPFGGAGAAGASVVVTYCRGDSAMTQVHGSIDGIADPQNPEFVNFIRQMTVNLFPPFNPDFRGDNDRRVNGGRR
jgi:hypothetical protein